MIYMNKEIENDVRVVEIDVSRHDDVLGAISGTLAGIFNEYAKRENDSFKRKMLQGEFYDVINEISIAFDEDDIMVSKYYHMDRIAENFNKLIDLTEQIGDTKICIKIINLDLYLDRAYEVIDKLGSVFRDSDKCIVIDGDKDIIMFSVLDYFSKKAAIADKDMIKKMAINFMAKNVAI